MTKINPRVDIAFKKLFGVEENKDLLISLINSIVSNEDQVKDIKLLNPYNPQSFKDDKYSILDIKAEGHNKKKFNIEIQMVDAKDYDKRALYYWAKLYTEQLASGEDYSNLNKAIGIHILNFTSILELKEYHNVFHITEQNTGLKYFKDMELHTIELTKFSEDIDEDFHKLLAKMKQTIDIWAAFLTKHDLLAQKQDELPKEPDYSNLKKAINIIDVMNFSEDERNAYEDHLKWLRDKTSALNKKFIAGKEEGLAEGIEQGIEQGIIKTILELLEQGIEEETISKATGRSIEEIKKLQSKN